jgi:hypothetical protein
MAIWSDLTGALLPYLSGGLAGSLMTFYLNRRIDRNIVLLEVQSFPSFQDDKVVDDRIQCFCRLTLKKSHKPIDWIELCTNNNGEKMSYWASRPCLTCQPDGKGKLKITHMRADDHIDILLLLRKDDVESTESFVPSVIDYCSSVKIYMRSRVMLHLS